MGSRKTWDKILKKPERISDWHTDNLPPAANPSLRLDKFELLLMARNRIGWNFSKWISYKVLTCRSFVLTKAVVYSLDVKSDFRTPALLYIPNKLYAGW